MSLSLESQTYQEMEDSSEILIEVEDVPKFEDIWSKYEYIQQASDYDELQALVSL